MLIVLIKHIAEFATTINERMAEEDEYFFELDPNADDIAYASTRCGESSEEEGNNNDGAILMEGLIGEGEE